MKNQKIDFEILTHFIVFLWQSESQEFVDKSLNIVTIETLLLLRRLRENLAKYCAKYNCKQIPKIFHFILFSNSEELYYGIGQ